MKIILITLAAAAITAATGLLYVLFKEGGKYTVVKNVQKVELEKYEKLKNTELGKLKSDIANNEDEIRKIENENKEFEKEKDEIEKCYVKYYDIYIISKLPENKAEIKYTLDEIQDKLSKVQIKIDKNNEKLKELKEKREKLNFEYAVILQIEEINANESMGYGC